MRLSTLFVVYLVATAAAIATPFAIHGGEMVRRRMIPVNSETPLELAPTEHQAPRGVFNPIPSCQAPDGTEYYMDYRFSTGSETEDRRVFVDDITVQSCAVGKDGTLYLVGTSENENWFRAYSRSGRFKWSIPRDEYCSRPAVARNGNTYLICMPRTGNTQLTVYDSDGQLRWALPTGGFEWSPVAPAIGPDGTIYAYTGVQSAPAIIAVTPDGRNLWSTSVLSQVSQLEVSPNGTIVVNIPAGHASAFDPQGRELWRFYSGVRVNNGGLTVAADGTV